MWFDGGRQWNMRRLVREHADVREFHNVLERGGVIGGSSAGATIQGHYLVRGDTSGPDVVMTRGTESPARLRFPAASRRSTSTSTRGIRWEDLREVIKKYPDLLGIGLSEGTAIVVTGDQFEVMGKWKVAIHDNTRAYQPWEMPFYVLQAGDVYDMKARKIVKYSIGATPARGRGGN